MVTKVEKIKDMTHGQILKVCLQKLEISSQVPKDNELSTEKVQRLSTMSVRDRCQAAPKWFASEYYENSKR